MKPKSARSQVINEKDTAAGKNLITINIRSDRIKTIGDRSNRHNMPTAAAV